MAKYKSEKEDLQEFFGLVFGKKADIKNQAARIRSNIYRGGFVLGLSVIGLAVLLLRFTG
jgi:hypothetical protein